ncbi:MAG: nitrate/nitrite transporter [Clostridiaceae bacterium]
MKRVKTNKWIQLLILAIGAGAIYQLPYLRYAFYSQLQEALSLNNFQYGLTLSVYGVVAMICYFPGGYIADRFSPKKLIAFSLISTGLTGFLFALFPSYLWTLVLHGVWGVTTILTYWAALLKITRTLGNEKEQGRLFGILEGARGLFSALGAFALLAVLTNIGSNIYGMAVIIRIMSWVQIGVGIATFIFIRDPEQKKEEAPKFKDIGKIINRKDVWMICGVIFSAYSVYAALTYVAPFLQDVYGVTETFATSINIIQRNVMMFIGGVLGGVVADKIGSRSKVMLVSYILLVVTILLFIILPPSSSLITLAIAIILLMATSVYVLRGLYFSLTSELKIPISITGTVVGFTSLVGFLPDVFIYPIIGRFLDTYPGNQGYVYMYILLFALSATGLFIMFRVIHYLKKKDF